MTLMQRYYQTINYDYFPREGNFICCFGCGRFRTKGDAVQHVKAVHYPKTQGGCSWLT